MKKIDIHIHTRMWKGIERFAGGTYATPEQIRQIYQRLNIRKGVILPGVNPNCAFQVQSNEEAYALTQQYPDLFDWFCNLNPYMGSGTPETDFTYFLKHYKALGAKGVGEITANLYFDDPHVENLFYHCQKNDMPLLFHIGPKIGGCYGLVDELGLGRLEKELNQFPDLKFIGHSQPFWAEISRDLSEEDRNGYPKGKVIPGRVVELMRNNKNLYGDLSASSGYNAIARDASFGCSFLEEFQDRLFFGTDICDPRNDPKLSFLLDEWYRTGNLSQSAYEKISYQNAERLLNL